MLTRALWLGFAAALVALVLLWASDAPAQDLSARFGAGMAAIHGVAVGDGIVVAVGSGSGVAVGTGERVAVGSRVGTDVAVAVEVTVGVGVAATSTGIGVVSKF